MSASRLRIFTVNPTISEFYLAATTKPFRIGSFAIDGPGAITICGSPKGTVDFGEDWEIKLWVRPFYQLVHAVDGAAPNYAPVNGGVVILTITTGVSAQVAFATLAQPGAYLITGSSKANTGTAYSRKAGEIFCADIYSDP